jgi:cytoskeletal protein CcmA (bactofilin family)
VPFAGVQIANAQIEGDLNLENAKLIRPIKISGSRVDGTITLRHVRTDSIISFDSSLLNGDFNAGGLRSESDLYLNGGTTFNGRLELNSATINSDVDMTGANIDHTLDAAFLKVGGSLSMSSDEQHKASFKDVILTGAKVTEQIDMTGASIDGTLDGNLLQVGDLHMNSEGRNKASFKDVILTGAKVTGQIDMIPRSQAEALEAGANLLPGLFDIRRGNNGGQCGRFLHGVAFLSWIRHPEPTGSRRATPASHFNIQRGNASSLIAAVRHKLGSDVPVAEEFIHAPTA